MRNGYHETSENVFQSGLQESPEDWKLMHSLSISRNKPLAVFNMIDYQEVSPKNLMPDWYPCGNLYFCFNIPDSASIYCLEPQPDLVDYFKTIGQLAANLHNSGYIIWFHCAEGRSRSTAANIAYRKLVFGESVQDAWQAIVSKRQAACLMSSLFKDILTSPA